MPRLSLRALLLLGLARVGAWAPTRVPLRSPALFVSSKEAAIARAAPASPEPPTLVAGVRAAAEALGLSEDDAAAFLTGALPTRRMSLPLVRLELRLWGFGNEDLAACESLAELREKVDGTRQRRQERLDELMREAKQPSANDKALTARFQALEKADELQGSVAEGQMPQVEDLTPALLLEELELRDAKAYEVFTQEVANLDAWELRWAVLGAREAKEAKAAKQEEAPEPKSRKKLAEMSPAEFRDELVERQALDVEATVDMPALVEAVRTARQGGGTVSAEAATALRAKQLDYIYEAKARTWDCAEQTALTCLPDEEYILADVMEIHLREAKLIDDNRSIDEMTPDSLLDNTAVPLTLGQYQQLSFDPSVDLAVTDAVVEKAMGLISNGQEDEAMALLEREPGAKRAFEAFAKSLQDVGIDIA